MAPESSGRASPRGNMFSPADDPEGMDRAVRQIKVAGEVYRLYDSATGSTRFVKNVAAVPREGRQVLELAEDAAFSRPRRVALEGEKRFSLWPDVHARYFLDRDRRTWRTIFWILPSVKVNPMHQRKDRRTRDAAGSNIDTSIGRIEGRRPVDKAAAIVVSTVREP
jgi:hypothetical protein